MPLYDYECPECGVKREALVLDTSTKVPCWKCEKDMVRCVSSPGLLVTNFHDKPSVKSKAV